MRISDTCGAKHILTWILSRKKCILGHPHSRIDDLMHFEMRFLHIEMTFRNAYFAFRNAFFCISKRKKCVSKRKFLLSYFYKIRKSDRLKKTENAFEINAIQPEIPICNSHSLTHSKSKPQSPHRRTKNDRENSPRNNV